MQVRPQSLLYVLDLTDEFRGFAIDEFEYSSTSQSVISKVAWHPLGEAGESLFILTSDGRLQYVLNDSSLQGSFRS